MLQQLATRTKNKTKLICCSGYVLPRYLWHLSELVFAGTQLEELEGPAGNSRRGVAEDMKADIVGSRSSQMEQDQCCSSGFGSADHFGLAEGRQVVGR